MPKRWNSNIGLDENDIKIPSYILKRGRRTKDMHHEIPKWPMIAFINTRSGGQLGKLLIASFRTLMNDEQVFQLPDQKAEEVLQNILGHMECLISEGDALAKEVRSNLRIIVAGGDGTAGWILGVIGDLKLDNPPPVATIPLGTGNNLPYTFGWGKKNPTTDVNSVKRFLNDVILAKPINVDSWHVFMRMKGEKGKGLGPEAPHTLHTFQRISSPQDNVHRYQGGFWNYFSIGMDAQVSYEFHAQRKSHPEKFKHQLANQGRYAMLGCTQGWFCAACLHPAYRNINNLAVIKIRKANGKWDDLEVSSDIRSIVLLNLPSFSGGLDPWGDPSDRKSQERGLTRPLVNDGLLEVVGFRHGWHGLSLLCPKGHGTRLAQASKVRIEFKAAAPEHTYMRMDGEPWKQPLPENAKDTVIEISHLGQVTMLARNGCRAKSKPGEAPAKFATEIGTDSDSDHSCKSASYKKFGPSSTLKYMGQ